MAKTTTRSTTKTRSAAGRNGSAGKSSSRAGTAGRTTKKANTRSTRTTTTRNGSSSKNGTSRAASTRNGTAARNGTSQKGAISRNSPSSGKKKKALRELAENVEEATEVSDAEIEAPVDEQDARRAMEIDTHFNQLTDITDQVALVNSSYDSDLEESFDHMEGFIRDAMGWDLQELTPRALKTYLSHMSFHREIVAEIISEARRQLMEGRRGYLKRLVTYHKEFITWFARVEKKYAA